MLRTMRSLRQPSRPTTAAEALAAYRALDATTQTVLDAWIARAVHPASHYYPCTRSGFEDLLVPCPYVSDVEYVGALLAAGYTPRNPNDVVHAKSFQARPCAEVRTATTNPYAGPKPRWLPEVQALVTTTA